MLRDVLYLSFPQASDPGRKDQETRIQTRLARKLGIALLIWGRAGDDGGHIIIAYEKGTIGGGRWVASRGYE
jgi:hypothetical protein